MKFNFPFLFSLGLIGCSSIPDTPNEDIISQINRETREHPTAARGGKNSTGSSGTSSTSDITPMTLELENYYFRIPTDVNDCLGEDDELEWRAVGSLQPGESFTFTPQYPGCNGHPAAISVVLSWQGSQLELSSEVPDKDFASWDNNQKGKKIVSPIVGNTAQLCMFPSYQNDNESYTITVTNIGDTIAQNVIVDGRNENDWAMYFYNRCLNADADGDGWNDSLEHSIANLVYPLGYIDGVFQPYILWGSNYLKAVSDSFDSNDEIDSTPTDFNDDGIIDHLDIDLISFHLGEGNGIPLEKISPNPGNDEYYWNNIYEWRRYDIDADGYVTQNDVNIVNSLLGQVMPLQNDTIPPFARVLANEGDNVPSGEYYSINGHVWDNATIARVEYLAGGKLICSVTDPVPNFGFTSPFNYCWWKTPKKSGSYPIEIRVYDAAGNAGYSEVVNLNVI